MNARYGLMKVAPDSTHMVKGSDGVMRQYTVKDSDRHKKAKSSWVCLRCQKTWAKEEELIAAHPEPAVLKRQQEAHPYGQWSEDPSVKDGDKPLGLMVCYNT